MEHLTLPHLEAFPVTIGLFTGVKNASFLREQLIQGNTAFEYAFLDASVLASRTQVLAATSRAVHDMNSGRMRSHNVHSEIVFSLSVNNNIAESFRRFGVSETTTALVAIKVGAAKEDVEHHLLAEVKGDVQTLTDQALAPLRDDARLRKIYQVQGLQTETPQPLPWSAQAIIVGNMALKGS